MIKRIKNLISEIRESQKKSQNLLREIQWAHIYHDSIRGKAFLSELPLNIGRWAGNYAFFYLLNRILSEVKPQRILEFGLGESSKVISVYLDNYLYNSKHLVIEQDESWLKAIQDKFSFSERSKLEHCSIKTENIQGFESTIYKDLPTIITQPEFDLYVVDGPHGSARYSRFDLFDILMRTNIAHEFVVIFDDINRIGEKETFYHIVKQLQANGRNVMSRIYKSDKNIGIITTLKYKFTCSL